MCRGTNIARKVAQAALCAFAALTATAQEIHLKARTIRSQSPQPAVRPAEHRILQFDHAPATADLESLRSDGFNVVSALPDNALVVVGSDAAPTGPRPGVAWSGRLEAVDKISPALASSLNGAPDQPVAAIVEFHGDVGPDRQDVAAGTIGATLQRGPRLLPGHALLVGFLDDFEALAALDEVGYIFPADAALMDSQDSGLMPCGGMLSTAGPVPQYANIVHGWTLDPDNAAHLGYSFGSVTPKVPASTAQSEVVRALNTWAASANIVFQPAQSSSSPRTVAIKFVSGSHGDGYPFDGPGGILAHTFYPVPINPESLAGDMHLDADENWHTGADIDVYSVALHEAGHAIGLGHSDKPGDVMYPYYRSNMTLSANDIGAAQAIYGPAVTAIPGSTGPAANPVPVTAPVATAALKLSVNQIASPTQSVQVSASGTIQGGKPPYAIQWQSDHGYTGTAAVSNSTSGTLSWTSGAVPLAAGVNNITVTAFDSASRSASQTASVTFSPPAPQTGSAPISVGITSPSASIVTTSASTLTVSGKASGGTGGIAKVTWQTTAGTSGAAAGTGAWVAAGIPLLRGTNTVIVRAWDTAGASSWTTVVAVRP